MAGKRRPAGEAPGQHFLRSKQLAADLVSEAGVVRGELVVEIGGGRGVLTQALTDAGAEVIVIERDQKLAAQLRSGVGRLGNVKVLEADAAEFRWPNRPFAVVANLPFARSGVILAGLLREPRIPLQGAKVIVQWEFATKQTAVWPATLRSTYWRAWYDVSIARRLDRTAFSPRPRVDAAVLQFTRRRRPRTPPELCDEYWRFLAGAFSRQAPIRRSLRASLSPLELKRLAPKLGFSIDSRAWDLDAEQWSRLFAFARAGKAGSGRELLPRPDR